MEDGGVWRGEVTNYFSFSHSTRIVQMDSETFSCINIGEAEKQQEVLVACGPWWGKHQSLGEEMWSPYIHFPLFVSQLGFKKM